MPLSDDQRAMLRLLAQREQGYDDLAALMGLSVEEVRAKVADALSQLEQEGVAPPPLPTEPPYVEEPPVSSVPTESAETEPPAPPVAAEPVEPEAPAPPKPAAAEMPEPVAARPSRQPAKVDTPQRPRVALPKGGGARAAIAAGLAVLVLVIVVLAVSDGGDSGEATTAASGDSTTAAEEAASTAGGDSKEVTKAILGPVDGGEAEGVAIFGRVKNSLALQVEATGLEPTGDGQSYTIWLYESPAKMLPLASTKVPANGKIGAQVEVPTEVLAYLAKETFGQIDISLTSEATLKASLAKATREKKAPAYTGTDVLRGPITGPIVGAADKAGK